MTLAAAIGRRRLLVGSIALSAIGLAVMPLPMPLWALVLVVAAARLSMGAGQPLTMSWVAESRLQQPP